MREKFYFFGTFRETAQAIDDSKARLEYLEAVIRHGLGDEEIELSPLVNALMVQTRFTLDRSKEIATERSEAGKKGGDAKSKAMKGNSNAKKNWEKVAKQNKTQQNETKQNEEEVEVEEEIEDEVEREEESSVCNNTARKKNSNVIEQTARINYMNGMRNVEIWGNQLIKIRNKVTGFDEYMNEDLKKSIYNIQNIPLSTFEERCKAFQNIKEKIKEKHLEKNFYYTIRDRDLLKFISKINRFYGEESVIISRIANKGEAARTAALLTRPTQPTQHDDLLTEFG